MNRQISTKNGSLILLILTVIVIIVYSYLASVQRQNSYLYDIIPLNIPNLSLIDQRSGADPLNTFYMIDDQVIKFVNGEAESMKVDKTPLMTDLTKDGIRGDAVLVLVKETESIKEYYITAALKKSYGYKGLNGINLKGASEIIHISYDNDMIKVIYKENKEEKTVHIIVQENILVRK